ncbi:MAG: hypothetical protein PHY28_07905 [Dehalococcoidales bacterium]|nr:hypothetical protein [Dehalococcoidales bacterium]
MSRIIKITRMTFSELYNLQILICASVLLLHILISMAVIWLANTDGPAGVGDGIALITVPILGLVFFSSSFKYTLSQGVSRKTFFSATCLGIVLLAAVIAILVTIFYIINLKIANVLMIYKLIYPAQGIPSLLAWEFAALLFLGMLGWCIRLIYYRSNRTTKYIVSIAPFVLAAFLILFNALADKGMDRAIWEFLKTVMGLSGDSPNPYVGMASLLVAAVILGGFSFLLLRRAQINE